MTYRYVSWGKKPAYEKIAYKKDSLPRVSEDLIEYCSIRVQDESYA
jgi:hypothetical protein